MGHKKSASSNMDEDSMPETDVSKEFLNFFITELKNTYWAEKHLCKALVKFQKIVSAVSLKNAIASHLTSTKLHVERLEEIFEVLGDPPGVKKSEAMAEMIDELSNIIDETEKGSHTRDARFVLAIQKIEQYEIATYDSLVQLARTMGNEDIISLLEETLEEEKQANETLTALAESTFENIPSKTGESKQQHGDEEQPVTVYSSINLTPKNTGK
ncbi:MAG: DUF892 family protein [Ferruginibacter sp.]